MNKILAPLVLLFSSFTAMGADMSNGADNFYISDRVTVQKVCLQESVPDAGGGQPIPVSGMTSQ